MSSTKIAIVFVLAVAVALADESVSADNSNVVASLLAAKAARLTAVNATLNSTESANVTVKALTKRSLGIDKSEGMR